MKVESYIDERGNEFVPGESVIVCTTRSHQTYWADAIYEGVNYRNEYSWATKSNVVRKCVVVSKPSHTYVRTVVDGKSKYEFVPCRRKVTLTYNQIYKPIETINILVR